MEKYVSVEEQELVIKSDAIKRTLVMAGPGSGKTEVVARRLAYLVSAGGLRPHEILVLSFSRSAVKALIHRIRSLAIQDTGVMEDIRFLSVRTFDSWTFRMLRFLGHDPAKLLENEFNENIRLLLKELDRLGPKGIRGSKDLRLAVIRHFIVDEYQDLAGDRATLVQKLLGILAPKDNTVCGFTVLGDPNQAIYDWSIDNKDKSVCQTSGNLIKWMKATYASNLVIHNLSKNHRAKNKLGKLVKRAAKVLQNCEESGENPISELRSILLEAGAPKKVDDIYKIAASKSPNTGVAVLCRYNREIIELATTVQYLAYKNKKNISSIRITAGTPPRILPTWIAKLLHQYKVQQISKSSFIKIFRLVFSPVIQNRPCSGDVEAAWKLLLGYARYGEDDTSIDMNDLRKRIGWPDSLPDDEGELDEVITLTTIHQSKGLEYNSVQIVHNELTNDDNINEEGRVLFVGMSRARDGLALLQVDSSKPFYLKEFNDGRHRWHRWIFGLQQLELGCNGDIDQESILRTDLMEGAENVSKTQAFLAENEAKLIGYPVTLEKSPIPEVKNRFIYKITLEDESGYKWNLGFLNQIVTLDLLKVRNLPGRIFNLRIGAVTTSIGTGAPHYSVPSPWRESRFWLSVCIHGIGQWKQY
jgi:DNA helicase-2/ATP-dependent DNA helicase PcrA